MYSSLSNVFVCVLCALMFGTTSSSGTSVLQLCLLAPLYLLPCGPLLVCGGDKLEPLPQSITQCLWEGVHISQDNVEGEGEFLHIGPNLRQLTWPFKYGYFDIQYGILTWRNSCFNIYIIIHNFIKINIIIILR